MATYLLNAKKTNSSIYHRADSQKISKARTMLTKNYSSSSIYSTQLWNLKNNQVTNKGSSKNNGEIDRIAVTMKLEQEKTLYIT